MKQVDNNNSAQQMLLKWIYFFLLYNQPATRDPQPASGLLYHAVASLALIYREMWLVGSKSDFTWPWRRLGSNDINQWYFTALFSLKSI